MSASPPLPGTEITVGNALRSLARRLCGTGQDDADAVAEQALAHLLGLPPLDVHLRAREPLPAHAQKALPDLADRLARHEPIQYVLGNTIFLGRAFRVDPRALIPRPETEELVGAALSDPVLAAVSTPRVADVGTGSGVIAVSLALDLPHAHILAADYSAGALNLARENARLHGVEDRIEWRHGDLLAGQPPGTLDGIVANLPYIDSHACDRLDPRVRDHEPRVALDGGPGGTVLIARLADQARRALRPGGVLLLEIGEDQGAAVAALLRRFEFVDVEILRDFAGRDRRARGCLRVDD